MRVATCAASAHLASFAAYFFSHCVHCHVLVSASYLSVPLAFSLDFLGFLCWPGWCAYPVACPGLSISARGIFAMSCVLVLAFSSPVLSFAVVSFVFACFCCRDF